MSHVISLDLGSSRLISRVVLCCVQVPMFSASGLRVAYLKIMERRLGNQYQVEKWVRKMCKSGDFLVRI